MKFLDKLNRQSFFQEILSKKLSEKNILKKAALESNISHLQNFDEVLYQS